MEEKTRKTGIDILGNAPWGSHFCQFYQTKEDLIDILIPYFKAGLENNEFCMWVTSKPLKVEEAKESLKKEVKDLDNYVKKGQIEILDYTEWYTKSGRFESDKVLQGWIGKEREALKGGFDGLRLAGNTFWLEKRDWANFADYEAVVNDVIGKYRMLAICSYSIDKCGAFEVIDVVKNHQFTLIKREGKWDIIESSERKKAEEALRESEGKYRDLIKNMSEGLGVVDVDGTLIYVNSRIAEMLEYLPEEMIGTHAFAFVAEESMDLVKKEREKRMEGIGGKFELVFNTKTGKKIIVLVSATPIYRNGKFAGSYAIFTDITDRKKAEEAIEESETKYRTIVENINDALIIHDLKGKIIDANQNASILFGYKQDKIIGKNISNFTTQVSSKMIALHMEQLTKEGKIVFDSEAQKSDGSIIPINISAKVVSKEGKGIIHSFVRDITERRRAEEALRESEEKYRTIFENVSDTIIYLNRYGTIIDANDNEETFGRKPEDIIGKNFTKLGFFKARDIPRMVKLFKEVITGRKTVRSMEIEVKHKDGHEIPIEVSTRFVKKNGKIAGFVAIARNITERKQAEEALRKSEEKYRILAENAMDGIYIISPDGFEYVNPTFEKICSYKEDEICSKDFNFYGLIYPEDREFIKEREEARKKGKRLPPQYSFRILTKEGKLKYVEVNTVPLPEKKVRILGILRDITEQKLVEEELRASEEKFRSLAEQSPNMIFINQKGRLVYANKRCEEIMGYKREEFYSPDFNFLNLIAPEYREKVKSRFRKQMNGVEVEPYEHTIVTKDNRRIDTISNTRLIDYEGDRAILGIETDITERRQVEEKIKESLREKEILLKEIHHRVKNNMQIISSLLKLQSEYIKDKKALQMFKESQDRVKSMALIHEKLYQSEDLTRIDFKDYIKDLVYKLFRSYEADPGKITLKANIKEVSLGIDVAIPCGLIINELVSNSLNHAFPQGREGKIKVALRSVNKDEIELKVSDNGVGLPEDFDFRQTKSLGLHLVTILAEDQLKGRIELNKAGGTEFKITFKRGK